MRDDRPVYGASPVEAAKLFWTRYATFSGRASRSEFWWWMLISVLVSIVLEGVRLLVLGGDVDAWLLGEPAGGYRTAAELPGDLWAIATLVPSLAQTARRLHDTARSGWWQAVALVPVAGWVLLLIWCARKPDPGGSRYDSTPLGAPTASRGPACPGGSGR